MAEIQTISAAFDVARLAWSACVFLKKVKDADRTSAEVYERATRLDQVLNGLTLALRTREQKGVAPHDSADSESAKRILRCIQASGIILGEIERKVGGFENAASGTALLDKVKIAFRHPSIVRLQTDLDARVQALQTELSILQLSDHAHTHASLSSNHQEVLVTLSQLNEQLVSGKELLYALLREQRKFSKSHRSVSPHNASEAVIEDETCDTGAIEELADCLDIAEELHERYSSKYVPGPRSIRDRDIISEQEGDSASGFRTPVTEESDPIPFSVPSVSGTNPSEDISDDDEDDSLVWPLEVLNRHIHAYHDRASKEREQGHYNQAEVNLQSAIKYSEMRQRHYGVEFDDRVRMHEEVAVLYQKQHKWAEAVSKVHQLLRESSDEVVQARQNQILASIYFDRHTNKSGPALSNLTDDIENAERHAKKAFNKRYMLLKVDNPPSDEVERHNSCTLLLIRILETRDKTVEANVFSELLSPDSSSRATDSLRRRSTNRPPTEDDIVIVEDKHELLISAIRTGDSDSVQNLLGDEEVNVEQLCREGKTPLMHAVEMSDETIVHKLLDPVIGADVSMANKRGLTALHVAASLGLHDMVRCLLHHDAKIEAKDRDGETALMKAVRRDQETIVQILSDAGSDMETKDTNEWSLLHHSIRLSKTNMINHLLFIAPDLKDSVDPAGKTALHHCADLELVDQAAALLAHENHVDVNAVDSVSRSPLYFAASKPPTPRRESMVQLLVDQGARLDESRPPPRYRDYAALKPFQVPRRASKMTRRDSVSTTGSVGTTSTGVTKLSRIFSNRMNMR